jgi:hypothetical protein
LGRLRRPSTALPVGCCLPGRAAAGRCTAGGIELLGADTSSRSVRTRRAGRCGHVEPVGVDGGLGSGVEPSGRRHRSGARASA